MERFREGHQESELKRDGASTTIVTFFFFPKAASGRIPNILAIYILSLLDRIYVAILFSLGNLNPVPLALCF